MKKLKYLLLGLLISFVIIGFSSYFANEREKFITKKELYNLFLNENTQEQEVAGASNLWYLSNGAIRPSVSSWDLKIPGLINCDTIDTDANGLMRCGIDAGGAGGSGTVTSVDMSVPTGLLVSGNPITTSGTLTVTYDTGYEGLLTSDKNNWNTAYGWGDHSIQNYFDIDTQTLDNIPNGTTYKLLTATKDSYVNQDVTNGSSPTFLGLTLNNIGYTFPSSDGTNGYTLKTNGSGTLTWSEDNNTTYTAGDNLTLTGMEFNVDDAFLLNTGDTASGNYNFDSGTLYIDASSDEIGIGTENPSARLHINYPTSGDVIFQAGTGDGSSDMNMRYGYNGYGWYYTYKGSWSGDNNEWQLWSDGAGSTDMQVYGIKQSGNITFMKDMAIEGTLTLNTPLTDAYVSDDLTVNGYMEDTDIDTFAELQSWVSGYTDNDTQLSQEQVEDYVGGMTSGTETHIAVTYDDTSGNLDYVVSDDWYNSLSDLQGAVSNDFHNLGGTDANTTYSYLSQIGDVSTTTLSNGYVLNYQDGWTSTSSLFIASNKAVGIGTKNPATKLQVIGTTRIGQAVNNFADFSWTGDLEFHGTADYLVGNNRYAFRSKGDQDSGLLFNSTNIAMDVIGIDGLVKSRFSGHSNSSAVNFMLYDTGIGTTTPSEKLSVNGNVLADGYIEYSPVYTGDALAKIIKIKEEKGTSVNNWAKVDHTTLPEGVKYEKDYTVQIQTGTTTQINGKFSTEIPVYEIQHRHFVGRNLGNLVQLIQKGVKELYQLLVALTERVEKLEADNTMLKNELCGKDNTYSFCK